MLPNEFTVYGSEEMLKPLILQLLAQYYGGGGEDSGGGSYQRLPSYVKGQCLVNLIFLGRTTNGREHKVEKSFRWVKADPATVTVETFRG